MSSYSKNADEVLKSIKCQSSKIYIDNYPEAYYLSWFISVEEDEQRSRETSIPQASDGGHHITGDAHAICQLVWRYGTALAAHPLTSSVIILGLYRCSSAGA